MEKNKKVIVKTEEKILKLHEIYSKIELAHSILSLVKSGTEGIIKENNDKKNKILSPEKLKALSDIDLAILKTDDVLTELMFEIDGCQGKLPGVYYERT
ncbi:hypothetical protein [Candidatus Enterococcus courvalinii]|uniref:Uncharacterized protein n=1 Tax=Candidatus Enterococcus courvalinii TaxID=2815329 RepID=A0ABS3HZB4_9ENTE|nr:hypothetical protein [Enterococcus sp. MSG2901]MBO0481808.1 hypothetical protein [Enterococcus sp. MSG2901]